MNSFEEQDYTKKLDFTLWKRLIHYLKGQKKTMIKMGICMFFVATFDALMPLFTKYAIDNFITPRTTEGLPLFTILYITVFALQAFAIYLFILLTGKAEVGIVYDIRKVGFKKLQELSFSYYDKTPVGWIMARMTSDAQKIGDVIAWGTIDVLWSVFMVIIVGIFMFTQSVKLALITLAVIPLIALISVYFQIKILASYREVRKTNSKITGAFNEGINGAKTTKTLVSEQRNLGEFQGLTNTMYKSSVRAAVLSALYMPLILSAGSIGVALALNFGGISVVTGVITLGTLAAFISYASNIFEPIMNIARVFAEMQSAQASAERTISLIETVSDIQDSEEIVKKYGDSFHPKKESWEQIKGEIEFKNVSFRYTEGEEVLENFNLKVKAGETIALVGETGSGKSTIVNLICRFYEPSEGNIFIDGIDYKTRPQIWLQSNLGYVLQTPHLFSGTIMENIRYGNLAATDDEVRKAAALVRADEFIAKLEKGMLTEVGEGGSKLSTGEKQLISFARAIIANPKIFVLDEATSSIDTETEQLIQNAIDTVLAGRTSFIIAHRLSTIRSADRILVIDKGKVLEEGSHVQLIRKKGHYYDLYTNQFKEEKEEMLLVEKPV